MHTAYRNENESPTRQYWVIGGEFADTNFRSLNGPPDARGPFGSYDEALEVWRERSAETRWHAHVRYTIAANPPR